MSRRRRKSPALRSGFEDRIAANLKAKGVAYKYEAKTFDIEVPKRMPRGTCTACGGKSFIQVQKYTPDFFLSNGVVIEAKGRLTPANRTKYKAFVEQYPKVKFRLLFQRDNPISKVSKTKYSDWCKANGIEYSIGEEVPGDWTKARR